MTDYPFAKASPEKLDEIIREAESLLDAQLRIASAADARAMTFAGLVMASVAVISNAVLTHPASINVTYTATTVICLLLVSIFSALLSARPTPWKPVGNRPANWLDDVEEDADFHEGRAAMAQYYDAMIVQNDRKIAIAANLMRASIGSAALAVLIGSVSVMLLLPHP